ncbi:DUF2442 domain-containing protein [Synechococcus sp. PCC 6312]|uniref:DUF2442 domain-containing protein n=1 Tax=Synechococcus sp. (strain ATCC 27167 / PCC 6312) TaxID=195253 RepID=UPI00029F351D|nr:DUF2442 domain-containing protein [Synechococcus sp. PCC 6312]AFY60255.1 Protein of unknown function (DUF2442) [Synechococcus sp. PCC 6312]
MICPKITSAKIIENYTLLVTFSNHQTRKYNCEKLTENPAFLPLKQYSFFKNFQIDPSGSGIVWNDEIDISEYEIWTNGIQESALDQLSTSVNPDHD